MDRAMDVIVGFGLAGSTLAASLPERQWLVVDPVAPADDARTFGCWARGPHPMDAVATRSWSRLVVYAPERIELDCTPYRYLSFRMADWRAHVLGQLPRARFVRDAARRIEDTPWGARVHLDDGPVEARWVFDSRFSPAALATGPGETLLWQSFRGARIRARSAVFDPEAAVWMDFRAPGQGLTFGYVLPEDDRHALVERVTIGPEPTRVALEPWLTGPLGVSSWEVEVEEGGVTPMTDHPFPRRTGNRVLAIGTAGGRLKPSTGYGVSRMWRDARAIAASLRDRGHPFAIPADRPGYRWLDSVFLRVLADRPDLGPRIFGALFAGNPTPRVLAFLDEAAGLREVASLALSLPAAPFLGRFLGRLRPPG
jgi:lycopene beta-cyclase